MKLAIVLNIRPETVKMVTILMAGETECVVIDGIN